MKGRINGLDLFSGIGGNTLALREWVKTVAYCEADRHAQSVLLSRMSAGDIEHAPICDDIQTLDGSELKGEVDIIIAGFPCQDISVAGNGAGLDGKRSGLFFEIVRLVKEIEPRFIFLENVPAIRTRGLARVIEELSDLGYDCRWTTLSAAEVGAPHKRERWFLLANSNRGRRCESFAGKMEQSWRAETECAGSIAHAERIDVRDESRRWSGQSGARTSEPGNDGEEKSLANADCNGGRSKSRAEQNGSPEADYSSWWTTEPNVGRVVNGLPLRVDRIKRLGNAVVPLQAREAFMHLAGIYVR